MTARTMSHSRKHRLVMRGNERLGLPGSGARGTESPDGWGKREEEGSCAAGSSYLELELLLSPLEILGLVGTN